ncbi:MAG: biopolymer transporter ExbD [Salibacteraceae bacterium]|jgi:biopolymer transport protein ExbD|nr:biopolymer transporter ExbD [Salibacteraceae bacterium]MDP4687504.1 biopolymer transporter ExbD [Salibacteraceae bacterium]MDP4763777.1 biopolymer transporter ExbD [Salibacteraceae bacterium]MDP4843775.1 biopolymer transporter ExbD [Salibacteraceae bacterium]MDP4934076.1 biopolymer transporter ExbD [Salibacteraceae bacterium]
MSKFKKGKGKGLPAVSTASLPDIVFMLLFFFMVTTVMREVDLQLKMEQPEATEIDKLENKSLVDYIYIGEPINTQLYGTVPKIQLEDDFATVEEIQSYILEKRAERSEAEQGLVTVSLKVDEETKMGIVTEVKQELRKVQALKINYSTREKLDKNSF